MTPAVCIRVFRRCAALSVLIVALAPRAASADAILLPSVEGFGTFSVNDAFTNDNDVAFLTFSFAGSNAVVRAETTSYATGGFDPFLALFDAISGNVIQFFDTTLGDVRDATAEDIDADAGNWDALLELTLAPGEYTLALLQYPNAFLDGQLFSFAEDATPAFTQAFATPDTAPCCAAFIDFNGSCRSGNFAFDLRVTSENNTARVPEPGTLLLLTLGSAAAAISRRRSRARKR